MTSERLARVRFLTADENGRSRDAQSGIHPQLEIGGTMSSCVLVRADKAPVIPLGEECDLLVRPVLPEPATSALGSLERARFFEGSKLVAVGWFPDSEPVSHATLIALDEHRHRVDHGRREPAAPATADELDVAERTLGFRLPRDVRVVYEHVANGGFGPGYGLVGIGGGVPGFVFGLRTTVCEEEFSAQRAEFPGAWPDRLLPICDWGCGIYSCVDCTRPEAPMRRAFLDALADGLPAPIRLEGYTFGGWLRAWLAGADLWSAGQE